MFVVISHVTLVAAAPLASQPPIAGTPRLYSLTQTPFSSSPIWFLAPVSAYTRRYPISYPYSLARPGQHA